MVVGVDHKPWLYNSGEANGSYGMVWGLWVTTTTTKAVMLHCRLRVTQLLVVAVGDVASLDALKLVGIELSVVPLK